MKEINLKKIKPLANYIIVTADRYTIEECTTINGIFKANQERMLKPFQKIVSASSFAEKEGFIPGQYVAINIMRYGYSKQSPDSLKTSTQSREEYNAKMEFSVPTVVLDGVEHLKLGTNDIEFIIEDFEEVEMEIPEVKSDLILPDNRLIGAKNLIN